MKKFLAIIFALMISLLAFAVVACDKPEDNDPVYNTIDTETFASAIEAYGDISNYIGVQGYKLDLDIDVEQAFLDVNEEYETVEGKQVMGASLSGLLNYADLSDVQFSLDLSSIQKAVFDEETEEFATSAKFYLYDEGLFVDTVIDFGEEQLVEKSCIRDFTNDFESVVEMLMPLESNPPFIAESDTEMTEEELTAAVMGVLDEYIYAETGMTFEELLASDEVSSATATMEYLSEKLAITYCASLGHYVLEINIPEAVELEIEDATIELPAFNLKVGLFAKENRITKFTVDFNLAVEEDSVQVSFSCGESTEKIVKPTSIEDYVEVSAEDEGALLTEIKVGYEALMEGVATISASRDNTLDFYASSQYEVEFIDGAEACALTFPTNNTIMIGDGEDSQLLEVQFMYSVIIVAASDDGATYCFTYTEATEEEPAYFIIADLATQEIIGIAFAVEADLGA
ncbi:MAG: hypothetical protein E7350_02855 [Clostridiales bacterium]|nr:hypothetical protein [Clostridiales bacterium]